MGRVVGADDIQALAVQGLAQGIAIGLGLDRRVAFDQVAEARVVAVIEQQVMHADLGGDALLRQGPVLEQRQLPGTGQVQYVQASAVFLRQLHRQG